MRKSIHFIFVVLLLCVSMSAFAQSKYTVSGILTDTRNGEALIGVTIYVKELSTGNISNAYGFYSLTLPKGNYTLIYSYIGYTSIEKQLLLERDVRMDVALTEESKLIQEIVIEGEKEDEDRNVRSLDMGVSKLDIRTIQKMPALLGEVDIVRSIQLTPGVNTVGEGAAGFNVRGGGIDQNLVLMDEAPVYNSSHLLGFFSVFNPDAVKDVKLIKGGIPASYGGRLSSVLDVRLKEGNSKKFGMSGGIGTIFSRVTVEAPIVKDKSSFIISGRRSYADLFLALSSDPELRNNTLYFYDLSAKLNYTLSDKDKVYFSGYFGRDVFKFGNEFQSDWGNATTTLRWNHLFNDRLFANFTAFYSNYAYSLGVPDGTQAFDWDSRLINLSAKADFTYFVSPKSTFNMGAQVIGHTIRPGKIRPLSSSSIFNSLELDTQTAIEYAAYIDHEWSPFEKLSLQYGLRYSFYQLLGAGTYYDFAGETGQRKTAVNSRTFSSGETVAYYHNPEPRFSLRYGLSQTSSIKASYNRTSQYIHLISNTNASAPTDVWYPSTLNVKPETADQFALGYFQNFKNNLIEASLEVYYKEMNNQIDYVDAADLLLNRDLEGELLFGRGRSYGMEWYIKKNTGKLNGWISYTLSRTERKIDGINNYQWYAAKFDRRHNLSIVAIYDMNERLSFSANFNYTTGVATTAPNARYEIDGLIVPHNTNNVRNTFRVPAYHRLDLAATLERKKKEGRKLDYNWVFSIYNLYARRNPYIIYFRQNPDNPQIAEAVRLSVFGSIIPAVTWNFKF